MTTMAPSISASTRSSLLRIACLEPSATAICIELGLGEYIVGITHECGPVLDLYYGNGDKPTPTTTPHILTKSGLTVDAQGDIHQAILNVSAEAVQALDRQQQRRQDSCPRPTATTTGENDDGRQPSPITTEDIPTLYPLLHEAMAEARPTVIFTQDLCQVCAPTTSDVRRCLLKISRDGNGDVDNDDDDADSPTPVQVVALQPTTLDEVIETFGTIATVCGVPERGKFLQMKFREQLETIKNAIDTNRDTNVPRPRCLILEWLDPPFDSGHWTYDMMDYAGIQSARSTKKVTHKALEISWEDVKSSDPDVVVVGCCGFDLQRNARDTLALAAPHLEHMTVGRTGRVFASNGDLYIAQPSPSLLQGIVLLAQCAYQSQPNVLQAIQDLGYESIGWKQIDLNSVNNNGSTTNGLQNEDRKSVKPLDSCVGDIEDASINGNGWAQLHEEACQKGELTYEDPQTGYSVFTAVAHNKRGKCCGSGCRHCPYSHQNVKDKTSKIQQPAILYRAIGGYDQSSSTDLFSIDDNNDIKVLFFSGGKDSFLTIRALVREHQSKNPFGLVLLTTFDATTRVIAHQEINVDEVVKQASHLNITLLGVPLRRGSGETYMERVKHGLDVIQSTISTTARITALVFGDLHLDHVKEWRDNALTKYGYELEYPLWKTPYTELMDDLEASRVPCQISGSTRDEIVVSTPFDRALYDRLAGTDIDSFGEQGEQHGTSPSDS
jgi:ABC-type Fe3+-hydroxamate transport system substrate-binding protein/diphthamide synthase (EF-2-diphthine--ammonia ligase)